MRRERCGATDLVSGSALGCVLYVRPYGMSGTEHAANCSMFALRKKVEKFALRFLRKKTESILLHVEKLYRKDGILT